MTFRELYGSPFTSQLSQWRSHNDVCNFRRRCDEFQLFDLIKSCGCVPGNADTVNVVESDYTIGVLQ